VSFLEKVFASVLERIFVQGVVDGAGWGEGFALWRGVAVWRLVMNTIGIIVRISCGTTDGTLTVTRTSYSMMPSVPLQG
jgi:hypothetical protein